MPLEGVRRDVSDGWQLRVRPATPNPACDVVVPPCDSIIWLVGVYVQPALNKSRPSVPFGHLARIEFESDARANAVEHRHGKRLHRPLQFGAQRFLPEDQGLTLGARSRERCQLVVRGVLRNDRDRVIGVDEREQRLAILAQRMKQDLAAHAMVQATLGERGAGSADLRTPASSPRKALKRSNSALTAGRNSRSRGARRVTYPKSVCKRCRATDTFPHPMTRSRHRRGRA